MLKITLGVVALNEEISLPGLLEDLKKQNYPHELIDIVLVDSMSTDGTKTIMSEFQKNNDFRSVKIIENPKRRLAPGCNILIDEMESDALVRIDAHARIPEDFISKNIKNLESGIAVSGGRRPNFTPLTDKFSRILLFAEESAMGSGFAEYRDSDKKKSVDSAFHAMYSKEVIHSVGYYNEHLGRTEDNDYNYRVRKAGYKIVYDPQIISYQEVRPTLPKMLRQKYFNGYWIGLTLAVNRHCFSLFHFVPLAFTLYLIFLVVSAIAFPHPIFYTGLILYGILCLFSVISGIKRSKGRNPYVILLPFIFFLLHVTYGVGTLVGIIQIPLKGKELQNG